MYVYRDGRVKENRFGSRDVRVKRDSESQKFLLHGKRCELTVFFTKMTKTLKKERVILMI